MARSSEHVAAELDAMRSRLSELQFPLGNVVAKATMLLADFGDLAPHPADVEHDFPFFAVNTYGVGGVGRELTVRLGERRFIRVDRNPVSEAPEFPLRRFWFYRPEDAATAKRVEILELLETERREELPYEIDTSLWTSDLRRYERTVGFGYVDQLPSIEESHTALDEARLRIEQSIN